MTLLKPTDSAALIQSNKKAEALEQQARDLARSVETVRRQTLAQSNERIEALEQKARDLACFVETTRQQILLQSDKKTEALELKARDLADFVETLRNQTRLKSEKEIKALGKKARDLAHFVESVRKETRLQFETEIAAMGQKARDLAVSVETVREMTLLRSDSEIAMLGQSHEKTLAMNEALMLGSVRQHELTEAANKLNAQLRTEISERKRAELELVAARNEISRHAVELEETVAERTAQLRETIGELEAFSYSVSHDMRAPLRAMRGFGQILLEKHSVQLDAQGIKYLEKIDAAAGRMDSLIQDVLTYTRVLRAEVRIEAIDLDALVRQVIGTYPQLHTGKVEIQIEGVLPKVLGAEASLAQCLSNLLTNAVKFVAPGTKARVKVWAEAIADEVSGARDQVSGPDTSHLAPRTFPHVRLWVEDNGIGIAPKDHVRIFKMFEQVDSASGYEGTGMGLSIVRKAVERMGGQMGVESDVGQGSKFWIQLKGANR